VLSEYKGKASTRYDLKKNGVFESTDVRGLARLDADHLLVSDYDDAAIAIINNEGKLIAKFGESGSKQGQLDDPSSIDWSRNGRLYVADKGNNRISVFGLDGVFIRVIGHAGLKEDQQLKEPGQVHVDARERVYVLEKRDNGIVTVFDHNGRLLARFDSRQIAKLASVDEVEITSLTIDDAGLIYLSDRENGKILQLDWQAPKLVTSFGSKGDQRGQFKDISSMVIMPGNKIAVADTENHKIEVYRLPRNEYPQ
jgi:DNA-binding beta-propeller fold protein YncE